MKLSKHEERYRAKQQLASKFKQGNTTKSLFQFEDDEESQKAIKKLINKVCK